MAAGSGKWKELRRLDSYDFTDAIVNERIPDSRCHRCGEPIRLDTDGHGRLVAYNERGWGRHPCAEAELGQAILEKREDDAVSNRLTLGEIWDILEDDLSAAQIAVKYRLTEQQVARIQLGNFCRLGGYNYRQGDVRRRERDRSREERQKAAEKQEKIRRESEAARRAIHGE